MEVQDATPERITGSDAAGGPQLEAPGEAAEPDHAGAAASDSAPAPDAGAPASPYAPPAREPTTLPPETPPRTASPGISVPPVLADNSAVPLNELMMQFESLGENCEFGLVQRRCEAEPLGLFRFASAPLPKLLAILQNRLDGFGDRENIAIELSSNGREYMVRDNRYGLLYHAGVLADELEASEIREREARRLPFLVRKLIEDLTTAGKLFVIRGMDEPLELEKVGQVLTVLRQYGANTLLWVDVADAQHPAGSVEWVASHLLKGYIDRFAPGENAHDLSFDCWVAICRRAHLLWRNDEAAKTDKQVSAAAE